MTTFNKTATLPELRGIMRVISYDLGNWRDFWRDIEEALPKLQRDHARARWSGQVQLASETIKARRGREGYYQRPSGSGVTAEGPGAVWTGDFVKSTGLFARRGRLSRSTDPERLYSQGGEIANFLTSWIRRQGGKVYDRRKIEVEVNRALERKAERIARGVAALS